MHNHDVSEVICRDDGSFVIDKGLYHVPNNPEFKRLWEAVSEHVKDHPERIVEEKPFELPERKPSPTEERLAEIEDALIELASIMGE